jgi:hypothetical protein
MNCKPSNNAEYKELSILRKKNFMVAQLCLLCDYSRCNCYLAVDKISQVISQNHSSLLKNLPVLHKSKIVQAPSTPAIDSKVQTSDKRINQILLYQ